MQIVKRQALTANLKTKGDQLGTDKLKTVSDDLNKLSDLVKNAVVKQAAFNTKFDEIETKIPDVRKVVNTESANISPQDVLRTSPFNIPSTSPKDPI